MSVTDWFIFIGLACFFIGMSFGFYLHYVLQSWKLEDMEYKLAWYQEKLEYARKYIWGGNLPRNVK